MDRSRDAEASQSHWLDTSLIVIDRSRDAEGSHSLDTSLIVMERSRKAEGSHSLDISLIVMGRSRYAEGSRCLENSLIVMERSREAEGSRCLDTSLIVIDRSRDSEGSHCLDTSLIVIDWRRDAEDRYCLDTSLTVLFMWRIPGSRNAEDRCCLDTPPLQFCSCEGFPYNGQEQRCWGQVLPGHLSLQTLSMSGKLAAALTAKKYCSRFCSSLQYTTRNTFLLIDVNPKISASLREKVVRFTSKFCANVGLKYFLAFVHLRKFRLFCISWFWENCRNYLFYRFIRRDFSFFICKMETLLSLLINSGNIFSFLGGNTVWFGVGGATSAASGLHHVESVKHLRHASLE
jgi:hypothetical protein